MIAKVTSPIIVADFLKHFSLLIDLRKRRLIDAQTSLYTIGTLSKISQPSILTRDATSDFKSVLLEFPDITNPSLIGKSVTHDTVKAKPRRLHSKLYDAVRAEFEFLLAKASFSIRPSKSPRSSRHVVLKSDSTVLPVGDYRKLNAVTEFDSYPMPTCMILRTHCMTFMHEVLRGLNFCFVYLDDILCFSDNAEEHTSHLRALFQRLSSYGLKLNASKCVFGVIGRLITPEGVKPVLEKVKAVLEYRKPEAVGSLRKLLGLLNFYRRFLPKAAATDQEILLTEFLKGSTAEKTREK
ncbi:Retrovirus-related Pol polyprotein from transposon 297 [Araneus ventricosus]|uniref:Retrovirus-related Pol polyprotein from transposon 297 n=1 Tax=Araneus ventricosus TaxID=182803 RepID=A0A4Y2VJP7_ARAVE|nr:Retrovirus-related Pol polyprotein from transposon 297 [Araneus ventricosus]